MMETKREDYIDIAKGFCMLVVICIHTELFHNIGFNWTNFAVPMFFFMSGFFDKNNLTFAAFIKKYAITLIVPSVIWVILGRIFFGLLAILNGEEPGWFSFDPYNPVYGNGPAWFLLALFYVKIIQWICCHCFSSRYLMYMEILMSCILGYIGINHQMPMQIDEAFAALPFYVSGKYLYPYLRKMIYNNWVLLMGTLCYSLLYFKVVRFWLNPSVNGLYNQVYLTSVLCTILSFALFLRISFIIATPPSDFQLESSRHYGLS